MRRGINRWIVVLLAVLALTGIASAGWWNPDWQYRNEIIINNPGTELTDYQVLILLNSSNFDFMRAATGGTDIRLTYFNISTGDELPIPHWIESWNVSGDTRLWIKVPNITSGDISKVYLYFGNSSAASVSNGNDVFDFFDDFAGTTFNSSKWMKVE